MRRYKPPVSEPPKEGIWWQRPEDIRVPFERFGPVWDVYLPKDYYTSCFAGGYSGEPERRNSRYAIRNCYIISADIFQSYKSCPIRAGNVCKYRTIRHVGGAMRGAGAEQISILVRKIVESKASSTVLRYFYGIGYKLDHEILKVGFAFRFQMLDYNVLGGKCNRGLFVIDSYKTLKGVDVLSKEETFLACTLGWCIEWVGLIAVNDGIILRNHISRILQRHFKGKLYYVDLIDLFNEVEFKTSSGQLLDLITTHEGEMDLTKCNLNVPIPYKSWQERSFKKIQKRDILLGNQVKKERREN
ncbi:farnesyl pyrophosphate synthase [Hordeum vulgare]|nr:farnesyl pyrophosphate synthase [Hordeum vulgare]